MTTTLIQHSIAIKLKNEAQDFSNWVLFDNSSIEESIQGLRNLLRTPEVEASAVIEQCGVVIARCEYHSENDSHIAVMKSYLRELKTSAALGMTSLYESISKHDDKAVADWNRRAEAGEIMRII